MTESEQIELEGRLRRRKTGRGDAMRASIVLLAAEGMTNLAIAKRLGTTRVRVASDEMRQGRER